MSHRQQAANQPTECTSHQGRGGAGQAGAKVKSVSAKAICWKQTFILTHTRTHRNPGMLPYAAFPIEWIGATWEGAINNTPHDFLDSRPLEANVGFQNGYLLPFLRPHHYIYWISPPLFSSDLPLSSFHYFSFHVISFLFCSQPTDTK